MCCSMDRGHGFGLFWGMDERTSNKQSKCKEAQGREEKEKKRGELDSRYLSCVLGVEVPR